MAYGFKTGGKKKGFKAPQTLQVEAFRTLLIQRVIEEQEPIIEALIKKGKTGELAALKEIFERVLGRVKEQMEVSGQIDTELKLSEQTEALLKEFISYREKRI